MDSFYIDPREQDSRQCRSRSNSHLSTTASQFQGLNIGNPESSQETAPSSSEPPTTTAPTILEEGLHPSPKPFISAPVPQQFTPFPLLSEADLDPNWSYQLNSEEQHSSTAPLLRLDPAQPFSEEHLSDHRSIRSNSNPTNMSTLGIQQYDSRFDPTMQNVMRQSYTWPQFDVEQQFMAQPSPGLSAGQLTPNLYDEPKFMSMYSSARSLSNSPPRASLTAEQRELKRQRDVARRDSKHAMRRERSTSNTSNPYVCSQNASPELMPRTLPEYTTTSLTPSPLLSQGSLQSSPSMNGGAFLAPFSPPLNDSLPTDLYGPMFAMGPNDFAASAAFQMPYTSVSDPSMQAFMGRPHSLSSASDQSNMGMYRTQQVSPKMGSSDSGEHVRVVHSRPKPQCWEHGCNGRQFSTFSNLLRHQREKSGAAQKSSCPNCGAEFTRTTARNGHMAHDKCKARRNS